MLTDSSDSSRTHPSLLLRVRDPEDERAWEEFHARYSPMIRGWCRQWFPREVDDMAQEVFLKLTNRLKEFDYLPGKGRFRGYLKTVTHRLMADLKERAPRYAESDGESPLDRLEASQDLMDRLAAEYDLELFDIAKERVRGRVQPHTWAAYVLTAEEWRKPAEVARELGMKVGAVFQAKHSVITQLRQEIETLQGLA